MKFILASLFALITTLCYSQTNLVIKGAAPLLKDGTEIYLEQIVPVRFSSLIKKTTTRVKDHCFEFTLNTDGVKMYFISGSKGGSQIFLQPGKANVIVAILRKITVTGNLTASEYDDYEAQVSRVDLLMEYGRARVDYGNYSHEKDADTALESKKMQKRDSLLLQLNKQLLIAGVNWIKQHSNSYINTRVLYDQVEYMPEGELKKVFQSMPAAITNNIWGKELKYRIDSLFVGGTAPNFSQADTNGRQVSLKSFRGKYVLLDFWASWCIPCREENPNLVKAITKFKNRNFTILSISMDHNKNNWIKAINNDQLKWTHLSELNGWQNTAAFKYYIPEIPMNYLIDPDGKIIAKNLHGEELNMVLSKILKD